ncbi:hypothetical protein SARC_12049 [Sphaeroforma arctica JP610]|uniref:proton-translocating NAD(P)(+) transhydrogenase n=1 Tax=Sphaeroforma arctica JP610 TaxID=667725 RepID=A0A0L0FF70_9EUKA|nr:hypothetical protein SARC_12049 [Sphaeroforma arctica JP610]KNC75424.1 hypothetical protein SARC_12049 [Sphaeroforma arctica JP610]|eukprot:XP_014149326.1 hypothetical protein SARC_12049 [Sphaeroforma arctica JP610]
MLFGDAKKSISAVNTSATEVLGKKAKTALKKGTKKGAMPTNGEGGKYKFPSANSSVPAGEHVLSDVGLNHDTAVISSGNEDADDEPEWLQYATYKSFGVPTEIAAGEKRVAMTPTRALHLRKMGFQVYVQSGAGAKANFTDAEYKANGAEVIPDVAELYARSDIVAKVNPPMAIADGNGHECDHLSQGQVLIAFFQPATNALALDKCVEKGATVLCTSLVPRITRSQKQT